MNNNHGRRRTRRVRQQRKQQKTQIGRILLTVGLMALIAVVSIGGTIAWLTDSTTEIKNTFSASNIDIELTETFNKDTDGDGKADAWEAQLVPGKDIAKNPKVTASADVPYFVFVKVTEKNWPTSKVTYTVADGWKTLTAGEGEVLNGLAAGDTVYYKDLSAIEKLEGVSVLANDKVLVDNTLTKGEMETIATNGKPELILKAYTIQKEKSTTENFTAVQAWNTLNPVTP